MSEHEPHVIRDGDIIPFNIGIAPNPEKVVLAGGATGKTFSGPSVILGMNGLPVGTALTPIITDETHTPSDHLTWASYIAWRKTKTRAYDFVNGPSVATTVPGPENGQRVADVNVVTPFCRKRALEEIDQATLELIGEVAELGDLFIEHGPTAFYGNLREKLIDECGDIFFCASWALDAWGSNPLAEAGDLEMLRVDEENELSVVAGILVFNSMAEALGNPQFVRMLGGVVHALMLTAQTAAGLTANSLKKLRYQGRAQDVERQVGRIATALIAVNQILIVANSSVEEALTSNMRKLDARYPGGYSPEIPGGIRFGEGK